MISLISQINAQMEVEKAFSASDSEIIRCLSGCVSRTKLIEFAIKNRHLLVIKTIENYND